MNDSLSRLAVLGFDDHGRFSVTVTEIDSSEPGSEDNFYSANSSELGDNCVCTCENVSHNNSGARPLHTDDTATKRTIGLSEKVIIAMFCLTLLFFLVELVAGFLLNSLTILADAWHMAGDAMALINGLVAITLSVRAETEITSFGWKRTLVIGAFANSIFLMAVSFITICDAITDLIGNKAKITEPYYMLWVGVTGLAVNLIGLAMFQYYRYTLKGQKSSINLHSHSHGHGHGHGHHGHGHGNHGGHYGDHDGHHGNHDDHHDHDDPPVPTVVPVPVSVPVPEQGPEQELEDDPDRILEEGRSEEKREEIKEKKPEQEDLNMRGIFLHVMSDALGSVVVIAAALLNIYIDSPYVSYADPLCSIIFSLLIIRSALGLLKDSSYILMQRLPKDIDITKIKKELNSVEHVIAIHELHIWQVAQGYNIATVHVATKNGSAKNSKVLLDCRKIFCDHQIHRSAIQIEKTS